MPASRTTATSTNNYNKNAVMIKQIPRDQRRAERMEVLESALDAAGGGRRPATTCSLTENNIDIFNREHEQQKHQNQLYREHQKRQHQLYQVQQEIQDSDHTRELETKRNRELETKRIQYQVPVVVNKEKTTTRPGSSALSLIPGPGKIEIGIANKEEQHQQVEDENLRLKKGENGQE